MLRIYKFDNEDKFCTDNNGDTYPEGGQYWVNCNHGYCQCKESQGHSSKKRHCGLNQHTHATCAKGISEHNVTYSKKCAHIPDSPQKKIKNTHFGDPLFHVQEHVRYPKQHGAKKSHGRILKKSCFLKRSCT